MIETTGLADPAPLIQSLYMDLKCKTYLRMDSILTVVDSKHLELHLGDESASNVSPKRGIHGCMEAVQQLCFADRVILNKIDLVDQRQISKVTEVIKSINPNAIIIHSEYSKVPVEQLLNIRAFDATRNSHLLEKAVDEQNARVFLKTNKSGKILPYSSRSKKGICVSTVSLTTEIPMDLDKFNVWIVDFLQSHGQSIYRLKGNVLSTFAAIQPNLFDSSTLH